MMFVMINPESRRKVKQCSNDWLRGQGTTLFVLISSFPYKTVNTVLRTFRRTRPLLAGKPRGSSPRGCPSTLRAFLWRVQCISTWETRVADSLEGPMAEEEGQVSASSVLDTSTTSTSPWLPLSGMTQAPKAPDGRYCPDVAKCPLSYFFPFWLSMPPHSSQGALGVTFTPAVSPTLAHLSTRQPTVGITLVQALGLFRLVLREGNVLGTRASGASNPELTIYQETEWHRGL